MCLEEGGRCFSHSELLAPRRSFYILTYVNSAFFSPTKLSRKLSFRSKKAAFSLRHPSGANGAPLNGVGPLIDSKVELLLKLLGCNEGTFASRACERSLEREKRKKKSLFWSGPGFSSSNSLLMEQLAC